MIQLIGFLLCVYMVVRGLDILSRVEDRKSKGSATLARTAAWVAFIFAAIFFLLFIAQGNSMPGSSNPGF